MIGLSFNWKNCIPYTPSLLPGTPRQGGPKEYWKESQLFSEQTIEFTGNDSPWVVQRSTSPGGEESSSTWQAGIGVSLLFFTTRNIYIPPMSAGLKVFPVLSSFKTKQIQ